MVQAKFALNRSMGDGHLRRSPAAIPDWETPIRIRNLPYRMRYSVIITVPKQEWCLDMPAERRKYYPIRRIAAGYFGGISSSHTLCQSHCQFFVSLSCIVLYCSAALLSAVYVCQFPFFAASHSAVSYGDPGVYLYVLHQVGPLLQYDSDPFLPEANSASY